MMEHVDEHDSVKAGIAGRYPFAIVFFRWNMGARPHQDVDSLDGDVRTNLRNQLSEQAVAAAHVEHEDIFGYGLRKMAAQDSTAPIMNVPAMDRFDPAHRLRIPNMLTKKLDKIV